VRRAGDVGAKASCVAAAGHLLLLREERPELELLLPDEERLLLPLALARSLCALLFCVLALPPLLAAWARLEREDEDDDGLEEEEEEELRDAIACSLGWLTTAVRNACGHFPI
jgi:hypothetical protein